MLRKICTILGTCIWIRLISGWIENQEIIVENRSLTLQERENLRGLFFPYRHESEFWFIEISIINPYGSNKLVQWGDFRYELIAKEYHKKDLKKIAKSIKQNKPFRADGDHPVDISQFGDGIYMAKNQIMPLILREGDIGRVFVKIPCKNVIESFYDVDQSAIEATISVKYFEKNKSVRTENRETVTTIGATGQVYSKTIQKDALLSPEALAYCQLVDG